MLRYDPGYQFVERQVYAQVVDLPAIIMCANDLTEARRQLTATLLDLAQTRLELGQSLPMPDPMATDPEMDIEEPIYLHLSASSEVTHTPAGEVAS